MGRRFLRMRNQRRKKPKKLTREREPKLRVQLLHPCHGSTETLGLLLVPFKFFAQLDPNRWSGDRTMQTCYEELEAMVKDDEKEAERPICCKTTTEGKEEKISEAIVYMKAEVEKG